MKKNIILMGLPGAGKGTQAERISAELKIPHISTGDMFREAIANGTELGKLAKSYMDNGNLVPDEVTNGIVKERLEKVDEHGFMLDGFPRTLAQAEALDKIMAEINKKIEAVIYLEVDTDILKSRLSGRVICRDCGATYNLNSKPPKVEGVCDRCEGHNFYQRDDDKPEVVENRLQVNIEQQAPIVAFYKNNGVLHKIPGDIGIDNVFSAIQSILDA